MKKFYLLLLPLVLAACSIGKNQASGSSGNDPIKVMTFNIRYDNPEDSLNNWAYRKDRVAKAVRFYAPDILGTQEVLHNQLEDLRHRLPNYEAIGVGREDGKEKGEYSALWYNKDRFEARKTGWFWLSETPEIVGSKGWDGACERIATWAKLQDKITKKDYFVLNTHLDHIGVKARHEGVKLILDKVKELGGDLPVIVTGDFNAEPESDVILQVTDKTNPEHLTDARTVAELVYGPDWTFHDFGQIPYDQRSRIDYIFVKNGLDVQKYGILAETEGDAFLSDHAPVLIVIK